jgi:hypothetical protein
MPGMCLTMVAVVAMLVVGRRSATAMVEEEGMAAAEEAYARLVAAEHCIFFK